MYLGFPMDIHKKSDIFGQRPFIFDVSIGSIVSLAIGSIVYIVSIGPLCLLDPLCPLCPLGPMDNVCKIP